MATPANGTDDTSTAPSLNQYINLANYVYTSGNDTSTFPTQIGYKPLLDSNGQIVSSLDQNTGFYGEAFVSTSTTQPTNVIVAFEGTNLKHNPPSETFSGAQVNDDQAIFDGENPLSSNGASAYTDAVSFTQTAIQDAKANGVSAGNIYLDGHSLGGAEAEYVAAKLNLPGTTFAAPGIPSSDFGSAPSQLTDYVDYGDPIGNYADDPPKALGSVVQASYHSSISHYGTVVYTGPTSNQVLLTSIASEYSLGTFKNTATAAALFGFGFAFIHPLTNYAADLKDQGVTLYDDDNTTGSDADFFSSLFETFGATACFASGTGIATARGRIPVEMLSTDDLVVTGSGERRPIRWLGHRTVDCRRHPQPQDVWPVRLAAHAFGPNKPARDLLVSPNHAICVDVAGEILIPASALINGATVEQIEVDAVTYWHVELDSHDILLAEGLPAESYLETGNRAFFAGADVVALHADPDAKVVTHADFCRPFIDRGPLLEAVKARLEAVKARLETRAARSAASPRADGSAVA